MRKRQFYRIIAVSVLSAFVLTATVPFFCATGWCCASHAAQAREAVQAPVEQAAETDCCGGGGPQAPVKEETDCCGGGALSIKTQEPASECCGGGHSASGQTADNSCDQSCATGCCKLAATPYVLAADVSGVILLQLATVPPTDALDTGIELSDYVPQPPSRFSA